MRRGTRGGRREQRARKEGEVVGVAYVCVSTRMARKTGNTHSAVAPVGRRRLFSSNHYLVPQQRP